VTGLDVSCEGISALRSISLMVSSGRITTLVGSNGAGKTTLLRTITGLLKPDCGTIIFAGEDITGCASCVTA
jgi:ABC-type branched-subunit amino acid transport system ATPase component